jgi:DNA-binding GntR family transcriptional regulator
VIDSTTTADRAAAVVREAIVEGRFLPGTRLPEQDLCETLDVSRNTIREALGQLVTERVLVRAPHRGIFVTKPESSDVRDVYRARRIIEVAAVSSGENLDEGTIATIRSAVAEGMAAAEAERWPDVASANQHFHRALTNLAGSHRLNQQMDLLLAEMRLIFHRMPDTRAFHLPYLRRNAEISELLAQRERQAASKLLADYLDEARDQVLHLYAELDLTSH